eukprot:2669618-Amphidinium_carterae.1
MDGAWASTRDVPSSFSSIQLNADAEHIRDNAQESPTRLAARMPLRRIARFKCLAVDGRWVVVIFIHPGGVNVGGAFKSEDKRVPLGGFIG